MKYVFVPINLGDFIESFRGFIKECDPLYKIVSLSELDYAATTYYAFEAELSDEDVVALNLRFSKNNFIFSNNYKLQERYWVRMNYDTK